MSSSNPSIDQLKRALAITEQIQKLETELASVLGGASSAQSAGGSTKAGPSGKKRRTMSPEARARIVTAQKARWAKIRADKAATAPAKGGRKAGGARKVKRTMSPESRAKIAAAARKRWAEKRARG